MRLAGVVAEPVELGSRTARLDLTLLVEETADGLVGGAEYSTDLFDEATIERMLEHYRVVLQGLVANPTRRISDLPVLSADKRQQLLKWNATEHAYQDRCIHELFQEQVERTPTAAAVIFEAAETGARCLALLGDSITTDHISPAGSIPASSPAGKWLIDQGVTTRGFNSYGSRRGNHEVMMRGTFANIRLRNELAPGTEGGWTQTSPDSKPLPIYDAAMSYIGSGTPLVVIADKEYGTGSSRDWAAKGTLLLGVRAVIAESFERIHRSNLVGMGVLPLEFMDGATRASLGLKGFETFDIEGVGDGMKPRAVLRVRAVSPDGSGKTFEVRSRVDTPEEATYYRNGGILQYVLRGLVE